MNLKYHLLFNRTFLASNALELRNEIYSLWKSYWIRIYATQGSDHVPMADDFARHDFFSALLTDRGALVGFSAHTLLDFANVSTYDLDYFQMFGKEYSSALQSCGIRRVMSFESLIIRTEFRHNPWNLPLSRLLMRINSYLLSETSADAIMAVSRNDNGVAANSTAIGYQSVELNKTCRGFPCSLQYLPQGGHLHPVQDATEPLAEGLWAGRVVHRGQDYIRPQQDKILRVA